MKLSTNTFFHIGKTLLIGSTVIFSSYSFSLDMPTIVDDFSNAQSNNLDIARQFMDDKVAGGSTQTDINIAEGKLHIKGEIVPPRGQPGWASAVQLLDAKGSPQDLSKFEGIRLLVKLDAGSLSVSANSAEITNFDYHAALLTVKSDGKFHEVKIPFNSMKRAWSEQTQLNSATINSLSIVAFGIQKTRFDFEVDEIGFY